MVSEDVKAFLSKIGKKGGKSKSAAKVAATRANIKKATAARLKKQK
jgi:hypothetical protein